MKERKSYFERKGRFKKHGVFQLYYFFNTIFSEYKEG